MSISSARARCLSLPENDLTQKKYMFKAYTPSLRTGRKNIYLANNYVKLDECNLFSFIKEAIRNLNFCCDGHVTVLDANGERRAPTNLERFSHLGAGLLLSIPFINPVIYLAFRYFATFTARGTL